LKYISLKAVERLQKQGAKLTKLAAPSCPKCNRKMIGCGRLMVTRKTFTRRDWESQQKHRKKLLKLAGVKYTKDPYVKQVLKVSYRCQGCNGDVVDRPMSKEEIDIFHAHDSASDQRTNLMFKPWHAFCAKFTWADPKKSSGSKWRLQGWNFIEAIESYIAHCPTMELVGCDDSYHASSRILVVHHELPDYYWGTTFLYIPQCTGEPPIEFFFYDNHASEFLSVMKAIVDKHERKGER
jgi:hypothetical protein